MQWFLQPLKGFAIVDELAAYSKQIWRKAALCGTYKARGRVAICGVAIYHFVDCVAESLRIWQSAHVLFQIRGARGKKR